MARLKLLKTSVESLPNPDTGQRLYFDTDLKGFGLRVGKASKAYFVQYDVAGRTVRYTIGKHGTWTAEEARKRARTLLAKMSDGVDLVKEKRRARTEAENEARRERALRVTLREVFDAYKAVRKTVKESTLKDYEKVLKWGFGEWLDRPLANISKDMVAARHTRLGARSPAQANYAMRLLRALFNFAAGEYEDEEGRSLFLDNPIRRLSHTRAWYPDKRRQTVIARHDLHAWFKAVMSLTSERPNERAEVVRDYLLLILFTGLRRNEAATLQWSQVDFRAETLTIIETKNGERHALPLSDFLVDLLKRRREATASDFVFPGDGATGYIIEPKRQVRDVIKRSGVPFCLHDLRRTFITVAEGLDIPAYALKRLLNHKMRTDVTAGYIVIDVERLRGPMQQITDYLRRAMSGEPLRNVVPLKRGAL